MARYYRFSKPVSDEESAEILKEMRDLEDIKMAVSMRLRAFWYHRQLALIKRRYYRTHSWLWHSCRRILKLLRMIMTGGIVSLFLFLAAVGTVTLIHPVMRQLLLQFFY